MKKLRKVFWFFVTLAGLYLVFMEIGMAISEPHVFGGTNILFFAVLLALGLFLLFVGLSRLCRKPGVQGN